MQKKSLFIIIFIIILCPPGGEWHLSEHGGVGGQFYFGHQQWSLGHSVAGHPVSQAA